MVLDSAYNRRGGGGGGGNYPSDHPLLKLLVPNYAAGALLGKGGAMLTELKNSYGANIRLSGGNDYYPGTEERIVVITGEIDHVVDVNNLIMDKLHDPGRDNTMKNIEIDNDRASKVKIVLTDGAAGLLIGRGGINIKSIQEESKARISVAMPDRATVIGERVVTVSGNIDERTEACRQIVLKIAEEPSNMANGKTRYNSNSNNGDPYSQGGYDSNGMLPPFNTRQSNSSKPMSTYRGNSMASSQSYQSSKLLARVQVEVEIPNVFVGGVLGKQGSIVKEFVQRSGGAKFSFSEQTDDTDFRTLTITGDMDQTQMAYSLVNDRVDQLRRDHSAIQHWKFTIHSNIIQQQQ